MLLVRVACLFFVRVSSYVVLQIFYENLPKKDSL